MFIHTGDFAFSNIFSNIAFLSVHFIHTREKPFIEDEHSTCILKQSDFHEFLYDSTLKSYWRETTSLFIFF